MSVTPRDSNRPLNILIVSAVDPNFIDGAVVQLVSLSEVLTVAGFSVTVMTRGRIKEREGRLSGDLVRIPGITIVEPGESEGAVRTGLITPQQLAEKAAHAVESGSFDLVIARDLELNLALIEQPALDGLLGAYLTNIPEHVTELTPLLRDQISKIARKSRIFFIQTEEARSFLEAEFPEIPGKTVLMYPMISDEAFLDLTKSDSDTLELVYSGKFKQDWKTLEMTELPARAAALGIHLTVVFMGDKFMNSANDPSWTDRMRAALSGTPGVEWLGAVSRSESVARVSQASAGLSWRDTTVDVSSQLSTKVLEYAAAGAPPLLRRNSTHEAVFGPDYPLFIDGADIMPTIERIAANRELVQIARVRAQEAVRPYSFSARAAALRKGIERVVEPVSVFGEHRKRTKVLFAGHDFKFLSELLDFLSRDSSVEISFDKWASPNAGRGSADAQTIRDADIIFCEWSVNNAVHYSKRKLPHQKLVVRMHRFEMFGHWPAKLNLDGIDAYVVIAPHMGEHMIAGTAIEPTKVRLIPNSIDAPDFARPKIAEARFQLGLAGTVPIRKRPDRALAVLRELRKIDPRFTLHMRGRLPSSYADFERDGFFRLYYQDLFRQFTGAGDLSGAVLHSRFGPDMANWYRRVGWILSPSTDEGSHQAVAEGMASGAVPVIWDWEGADRVYPREDVFSDEPSLIARHIADIALGGTWDSHSERSRLFVQQYDSETIHTQWAELFRSLLPEDS
ncbi:hypothetical protein EDF60_2723 [Leucobacter luti]|uniref:glycosyltransferase n=1 Tax=Leucobacter luti TaxID=340320 RepID=UPI00104A1162|nr:glycosyltransferase [Leucobacter luti]MCW2289846.1 glycosyltransferase involved in cell wall biosynthesis [Leucobacter luti]TCK36015.1 hypothetical protein EDF60_2723 [Leucobacter luti]